jgi:hypothetical protein
MTLPDPGLLKSLVSPQSGLLSELGDAVGDQVRHMTFVRFACR